VEGGGKGIGDKNNQPEKRLPVFFFDIF